MKKIVLGLILVAGLLLLSNPSYAQCPDPEAENDLGICDTFYFELYDSANNLGNDVLPRKIYFPMYYRHDVSVATDSMAGFIVPLGITHSNSAAYCSTSSYWNQTVALWVAPQFPRSIFRWFPNYASPGASDSSWMAEYASDFSGREWDFVTLDLVTNNDLDSAHWFLVVAPTGSADQRYGFDGVKKLLATMTLQVEDTMTIYIDSTFWLPSSRFMFSDYNANSFVPRHHFPCTTWVLTDTSYMRCGQDYVEGLHQLPNVPTMFSLSQNYPNPFNANTTIEFAITENGNVNLEIYNILGRKVETLVDKNMDRGTYKVTWNADVPSGVYFYKIVQGNSALTKKMILLK